MAVNGMAASGMAAFVDIWFASSCLCCASWMTCSQISLSIALLEAGFGLCLYQGLMAGLVNPALGYFRLITSVAVVAFCLFEGQQAKKQVRRARTAGALTWESVWCRSRHATGGAALCRRIRRTTQ